VSVVQLSTQSPGLDHGIEFIIMQHQETFAVGRFMNRLEVKNRLTVVEATP
jgi:hypothetical protein